MVSCNLSANILQEITKLPIPQDDQKCYTHICSPEENFDNAIYFIGGKLKVSDLPCMHTRDSIIFVDESKRIKSSSASVTLIYVSDTRMIMMEILIYVERLVADTNRISSEYFTTDKKSIIHKTAIIEQGTSLGANVYIGPQVYIGTNVKIGDGTKVLTGARIIKNTIIGDNCLIRENSVIGGNGFGIEKDGNDNNIRIPQLGGVVIGDNVEIGALNTVCSGTIRATYIGNYVKTDDHVHVAHNDRIEDNCIITAGVILSGSVTIHENAWVGINSSVKQGIVIGEKSLIGMAACVNKDVNMSTTVVGNPAKEISEFVKMQKKLNSL